MISKHQREKQLLVGGFNPSEKYESQLGILFPIYGKIKFMFQTTNQNMSSAHSWSHLAPQRGFNLRAIRLDCNHKMTYPAW